MYYLGIDWATEKHDLCLLDDDGTIVQQLEIKQSNHGFQRFENFVNHYGATNMLFNIERSDGLLVDWMLAQGWALYITPSVVVAHRRPRRSKSDRQMRICWHTCCASKTQTADRSRAPVRSCCICANWHGHWTKRLLTNVGSVIA